jgi:hypothetical protein
VAEDFDDVSINGQRRARLDVEGSPIADSEDADVQVLTGPGDVFHESYVVSAVVYRLGGRDAQGESNDEKDED